MSLLVAAAHLPSGTGLFGQSASVLVDPPTPLRLQPQPRAEIKTSLVGPLPSAQGNEAQERLAESIGLIARLPRLATSRGIDKFALPVSLPLIRARKSLRDSASPNSTAQRYIKAAFS